MILPQIVLIASVFGNSKKIPLCLKILEDAPLSLIFILPNTSFKKGLSKRPAIIFHDL